MPLETEGWALNTFPQLVACARSLTSRIFVEDHGFSFFLSFGLGGNGSFGRKLCSEIDCSQIWSVIALLDRMGLLLVSPLRLSVTFCLALHSDITRSQVFDDWQSRRAYERYSDRFRPSRRWPWINGNEFTEHQNGGIDSNWTGALTLFCPQRRDSSNRDFGKSNLYGTSRTHWKSHR